MILQSDPSWATARLGFVTASRIADVMAKTKSGPSTSRANYAAELIAERLTGTPGDRYTNAAMQWGIDTEPHARAAYEFHHDVSCGPAAFITHPTLEWSAATPDGFIDADGLVEFKCPNTATHIDTLLSSAIPEKYRLQMQWQMACSARAWCDFVSFDPRLPEEMRMFVKRIKRDDDMIGSIEKEVTLFLGEVSDTLARLRRSYGEPSPTRAPLAASLEAEK